MRMLYTQDNFEGFKEAVRAMLLKELEEKALQGGAWARKRYETGLRLASNPEDGTAGRLQELLSHRKDSTITQVRRQHWTDTYLDLGQADLTRAEVKTTGGRIEDLYELARCRGRHFVVYTLAICNKNTSYCGRYVRPLIFEVNNFLRMLEECGAVKRIGGSRPQDQERSIQASSAKLYKRLEAYGERYGLWFDPDRRYDMNEILEARA